MEALFHKVMHLSRKKMHKGNILLEKRFCYEPKLEIRFKMCRFSDFSTSNILPGVGFEIKYETQHLWNHRSVYRFIIRIFQIFVLIN